MLQRPATAKSAPVRSLVASETVKVSVVLWPALRGVVAVSTELVMATVGGTVSMVNGVMGVVVVTAPVPLPVVTFSCGV